MELQAGEMLGPYRLVERIGAGGMAEVWKAFQPRLDRYVAIKVLPRRLADEPSYVERFEREARAISRLDHPNVLTVHDFGEQAGQAYMVSPLLTGGTLARQLGHPWSVGAALRVLEPLAAALDYAHGQGIVHRDVKPSNVLLAENGRLVLSDFGIARLLEGSEPLTQAGMVLGTPEYMSPEQVQGEPATPASDIYSLGVIAYELLTGRRPFQAETPMAVALAHLHKPLPPPRSINPALSAEVEAVLLKALAKDPVDRYASGAGLVSALRGQTPDEPATVVERSAAAPPIAASAGASQPPPPATSPRAGRSPRLGLLIGLGLAILLGGGAAVRCLSRPPDDRAARPAATATPAGPTPAGTRPVPGVGASPSARPEAPLAPAPPSPSPSPRAAGGWQFIGSEGSGPGQFKEPRGVDVDDQGNVYVADTLNQRIQKLAPNGRPLAQWGTAGEGLGQVQFPAALTVDGQGNIYVVDAARQPIQKLAPDGHGLARWGALGQAPGQVLGAEGIALDRQGNLYVTDSGNHRLLKLSPTGEVVAQWGRHGSAPGELDGPRGVAVDGQGNIYVSETTNSRIQKLSPAGQPLAQWGGQGGDPGQLRSPGGLALDGEGNLYVADTGNARIQKLSPTGRPLARWGEPGDAPGRFIQPIAVALDNQGTLYVVDRPQHRLHRLVGAGGQ